jgi:hypothetical protein
MRFSAYSRIVVLAPARRIDYHRQAEVFTYLCQNLDKTSVNSIKSATAMTRKFTSLEVFVEHRFLPLQF